MGDLPAPSDPPLRELWNFVCWVSAFRPWPYDLSETRIRAWGDGFDALSRVLGSAAASATQAASSLAAAGTGLSLDAARDSTLQNANALDSAGTALSSIGTTAHDAADQVLYVKYSIYAAVALNVVPFGWADRLVNAVLRLFTKTRIGNFVADEISRIFGQLGLRLGSETLRNLGELEIPKLVEKRAPGLARVTVVPTAQALALTTVPMAITGRWNATEIERSVAAFVGMSGLGMGLGAPAKALLNKFFPRESMGPAGQLFAGIGTHVVPTAVAMPIANNAASMLIRDPNAKPDEQPAQDGSGFWPEFGQAVASMSILHGVHATIHALRGGPEGSARLAEGEIPARIEPVNPEPDPLPQGQDSTPPGAPHQDATPSAESPNALQPAAREPNVDDPAAPTTPPVPLAPVPAPHESRSGLADRPAPIRDHRASGADSRPPGGEGRNETSSTRAAGRTAGHSNAEGEQGADSRPNDARLASDTPAQRPARDHDASEPAAPVDDGARLHEKAVEPDGLRSERAAAQDASRSDPHDPGGPHNDRPAEPGGHDRPTPHPRNQAEPPTNLEARVPHEQRPDPSTVDARPPQTDPPGRHPVEESRSAGNPTDETRSAGHPTDETVSAPHPAELTRSEQPVADPPLRQGRQPGPEHTTVEDQAKVEVAEESQADRQTPD